MFETISNLRYSHFNDKMLMVLQISKCFQEHSRERNVRVYDCSSHNPLVEFLTSRTRSFLKF